MNQHTTEISIETLQARRIAFVKARWHAEIVDQCPVHGVEDVGPLQDRQHRLIEEWMLLGCCETRKIGSRLF